LLTAFDPLLIGMALMVMSVGLARRWALWRSKFKRAGVARRSGDWFGLITYLMGQAHILKKKPIGIFHLLVFWGVTIPLVVIILAQSPVVIPQTLAWSLSFAQDMLGLGLLAGTVFFGAKRIKPSGPDAPKRTLLPAVVILVIVLTGFFAEGARLGIVQNGFSWASPIGSILSLAMPASPKFMQLMIRCHFLTVLLFLAMLPFTFMRHVPAAALNVVYRKTTDRGQLSPLALNAQPSGAKTVLDLNWKQLLDAEACVSCGRCEENCPAAKTGKPLSPRKVMQNILEQTEAMAKHDRSSGQRSAPLLEDAITEYEIWECSTCMACVEHCPVFVEPMDKIIDLRRHQVMDCSKLPAEAAPLIQNLEVSGNAMGEAASNRTDWALDFQIPHISSPGLNPEILLWPGCMGAFHKDYQKITLDMAKILSAAGVRFGILGPEESCCADPARRLGEERLFQTLAKKNIDCINSYPVKKIVTLCPHCFNTLKNEYPDLGGKYDVVQAIEFVMQLITQKRIVPRLPVKQTLTIHDPCYLGRLNRVYQPLRAVCEAVPGLEIYEIPQSRNNSFCCGGGGGRMWLNQGFGLGMNLIRSEHLLASGADLVGTACPHCLIMLDDGLGSLGMEQAPKPTDIIAILASSMAYAQ
jgi:Fe-S oxidoreductase